MQKRHEWRIAVVIGTSRGGTRAASLALAVSTAAAAVLPRDYFITMSFISSPVSAGKRKAWPAAYPPTTCVRRPCSPYNHLRSATAVDVGVGSPRYWPYTPHTFWLPINHRCSISRIQIGEREREEVTGEPGQVGGLGQRGTQGGRDRWSCRSARWSMEG